MKERLNYMELLYEIRKCKFCEAILSDYYLCHTCKIHYTYGVNNQLVNFCKKIYIEDNTYYIDFNVNGNYTRVSCYNAKTYSYNREVFRTTGLLDITAKNLEEKIRLYETFK